MKQIIITLFLLCITISTHASQHLPLLNNISHIVISSNKLEAINISDPEKILYIVKFFNVRQSNWVIAKHPLPSAKMRFSFYSNNEHITDIGLSPKLVDTIYGQHWSQAININTVKQFAGSIHPAIEENLFPIIPLDASSQDKLNHWQQKLTQLETGLGHREIKSFLRKNGIRIKYVNSPSADNGYWMNLELSLVNNGDYVDTIIAAKMFLNQDHSLKSTYFLGYQLARKAPKAKRLSSNLSAANL